uniref:Putative metalloprotease n=1 Tax=Ixodes ricinus TaxID=34613 RepID=A0A0K8RMD9_IXORI
MNAPKLRELLLLLLSASVSAAPGSSDVAPNLAACAGEDNDDTLYVGLHILTDQSFRACSPYRKGTLEDYLRAFVGAVDLYFRESRLPAVKVVFLGASDLTEDEEHKFIRKHRDASGTTLKGGDVLKEMMDIATEDKYQDYVGSNKVIFILTWFNITEEITENKADDKVSIPDDDYSYSESSESSLEISARSKKEKKFENVGALSNYGSICSFNGIIGQDNGKNFSGVSAAATQVATILGPMYNGSIRRRVCDDEYMEPSNTPFHSSDCSTKNKLSDSSTNDMRECLTSSLKNKEEKTTNPSNFFETHKEWTPCGVSYTGSKKCEEASSTLPEGEGDCHISCCPPAIFNFIPPYAPIPAPDGQVCSSNGICINGNCSSGISTSVEG